MGVRDSNGSRTGTTWRSRFRTRQLGDKDGHFRGSGWSQCSYSQMAVPGLHLHSCAIRALRSQLQIGKFRLSPALSGATMSEAYLRGFSSYLGTVKLTLLLGKGSMLQEVGQRLGMWREASVLVMDWSPVWIVAPCNRCSYFI